MKVRAPLQKLNGFVIVQHVRNSSLVAARASLPGCAAGRADHSACDKDAEGTGFPGEETSDALIRGTAIQKRRGDETEARAHVRQDRKGSRQSLCARNVLPRAAQGKLRLDAGRGIRVERSAGSKSLTSPQERHQADVCSILGAGDGVCQNGSSHRQFSVSGATTRQDEQVAETGS